MQKVLRTNSQLMHRLPFALAAFTLIILLVTYYATVIPDSISPQGCRMSYMSPSYRPQTAFDISWSPLARRYSLWLYREQGWDNDQPIGVPVLFIPGNAGSSHQVRSIASSATRQFYSQPAVVSSQFLGRQKKPLDFFAVDFNEDLSAFHGPTMESQISYTKAAISYILSLYPINTPVIILGHSMGGVVATSLLPSQNISAIITMSTPHTLPPARFDGRVDAIYRYNHDVLAYDPVPIVSLCGGSTDTMIPSESCILPIENAYRRTLFTSALEGAWTGVGHREMVWCHQVRWRVARAALELHSASTPQGRAQVLQEWLRDGRFPPPNADPRSMAQDLVHEILPENIHLILKEPKESRMYLVPTPPEPRSKFMLFLSQGSIGSVSPQNPLPLRVTVSQCETPLDATTVECTILPPISLRLLPTPIPGHPFPVAHEGSDESDGVVVFEADADMPFVGVKVEGGNGKGWVVGGFVTQTEIINQASMLGVILSGAEVELSAENAMRTMIRFPNLVSNALLVFKLESVLPSTKEECFGTLMPPLVVHTSGSIESHYYPLQQPVHLHSHIFAPYIPKAGNGGGLNFTVHSTASAVCSWSNSKLTLKLDWWASLGRLAARFGTTLVLWAVGTAALCVFQCWSMSETGNAVPEVRQTLEALSISLLKWLAPASWVIALLPLPAKYFLGTGGEAIFSFFAPLLMILAFGLVIIVWQFLQFMLWASSHLLRRFFSRRSQSIDLRSTIFSVCLVCVLVSLFIPWQVAFLASWIVQFFNCSSTTHHIRSSKAVNMTMANNHNHSMHFLLFMTWLLPLTAPVLAVWTRTLLTAGFTAPFDGDHFFLNVAPFLILVEFVSRVQEEPLFLQHRLEASLLSVRWCFAVVAFEAYIFGARTPYSVLDVSRFCVVIVLLARVGSRYWTSR